ncbi:MAG TPA: redoxin domain-containing protein [Anaerolineae bacterium]|nr:redoxin domain-containing protein [Anaerolineae bacterium]
MTPPSRLTWIILLLAAALGGSSWLNYNRQPYIPSPQADATTAPLAGYLAPTFTLDTITGQPYDLVELRGQPVVLNFWATWCPPCRQEMPFFQAASKKFNGQATLLSINQGETNAQVTEFAIGYGLTYPLLMDPTNNVNQTYRIRSLPTTVFIDRHGRIAKIHIGIISQAVLEDEIQQLLSAS